MIRKLVKNQFGNIKQLAEKSLRIKSRNNLKNMINIVKIDFSGTEGQQKHQQYEFKAETKKLLDIVAKSLYTDAEVFIRELLSNASDALEKQRYLQYSGQDVSQGDPLNISIICDESKKQIIIQDTGVGMNKQDLIDNLGTIASSGSKKFMEQIEKDTKVSGELAENIIGQFGVGFYSAFIVGDTVEVITKKKNDICYRWTSDGSGMYDIEEFEGDCGFERGTKVIIHLRPNMTQFTKIESVKSIINKHSGFINYDIYINGEKNTQIGALWTKDKREITDEQYNQFYQHITNLKYSYKFKLHYSADVPLMIKALLYVGPTHSEKYGMNEEQFEVSLYCRKVLIKQNCRELLPRWLRFVKGVIDCEDLPLNISRENYQDSALIAKLKGLITKRVLKMFEEQANNNSNVYLEWYKDFQLFFKEGLATDQEYSDQLLKLCRYQTNQTGNDYISLDDYISKLKPGVEKIYFLLAPNREAALNSPYFEPFKNNKDIPVIFINLHVDEMVFQGVTQYKNKYKFINIETSYEEISQDFPQENKNNNDNKNDNNNNNNESIPEDDIPSFSLWLKKELEPVISKIQVSKRLTDSPALIQGQMSSGMRQIMQMLEKDQNNNNLNSNMNNNLTLEINPNHPLMVRLNHTRQNNIQLAAILAKQILDNTMLSAGILDNQKTYINRVNRLMMQLMGDINAVNNYKEERVQVPDLDRELSDEEDLDHQNHDMKKIMDELKSDDEKTNHNPQEIVIDKDGNTLSK